MPRPDFRPEYFDLPAGPYAIPAPYEVRYRGEDEGVVIEYLYGNCPFSALSPDHVAFLRQEFLKSLEGQRARVVDYFSRRVPRRYRNVTPDDRITTWAETFATDPADAQSLLILGPTGTGKTHLGWTAIKAASEASASPDWRAFTAADMYAHLRPNPRRDSEDEFQGIAGVRLLLLDDLGAAKLTEWTEEVTYRLINHRYEQCLPGIYTSNVPPAQLRDVLGERIVSRLTEMCDRMVLKGDDRRKGGAQ